MEVEPEIAEMRLSETLLIAVDSYVDPTMPDNFHSLRDAAMRLARTRLIYSTLKDDLIAVIKSGSENTNNKLAVNTPGGYQGIEILHPPVSRSLDAVRALADMTLGKTASNLLNLLDVCGDTLSLPAVERSKKKRLVLFTEGREICKSVSEEDSADFEDTCELFKNLEMKVDVICLCDAAVAEALQELEEQLADEDTLSVKELKEKTATFSLSSLFVLSRCTGGSLLSFQDASPLVDRPIPKVKRAMAKYRGTLNIADILKIPVKRFSYVSEAKHISGKKISWDASTKRKEAVPVLIETQRVASAKDDVPLEIGEIVNAYPYGPELVPEQNEVDTYAWSIHLPKGLDVLGFVEQNSVPAKLLMGHVDVVISMPGVYGADRLMKSLVLALHAENLGILARSVSAAKGGSPQLAYLWPRVERCKKSGVLRNFFLFMVEIPMREDIRNLPFASLEDTANGSPENANLAMDRYITATLLEKEEGCNETEEDEEDEEAFWPPNLSNPNLDWFNICVLHRALAGPSRTDFPPLSAWHKEIIDPVSFLRDKHKDMFSEAIQELKTGLPVIPVKRKDRKSKRVHEAVNGDLASILHYLPMTTSERNEDVEEDDIDEDNNVLGADSYGGTTSTVTDFDVLDVGDRDPVPDFETLVAKGKFSFAAVSLLVVVRRLIRDLVDDDKALECLKALRKASVEKQSPRFFNDFIISMASRCNRKDPTGNRTAAFFRHVARCGEIASTIDIISVTAETYGESETSGDRAHREFLEHVKSQVAEIASKKTVELSTSMVSRQ